MPRGSKTNSPAPEADETPHRNGEIVRHLTEQLRALEAAPPVAVAVSGGGDSVALARLLVAAAPALGLPPADILAVTVDHGLRPDSAQEAETVHRWMGALGLSHHILRSEVAAAGPGLQAAARQARYALILDWCVNQGVCSLLTAHTADDQAETLLMRLARGSGVDGLSGIAPARFLEAVDGTQVRLLRPLLGVPRAELRHWLEGQGACWIEDPSNENRVFDRVKARQALALLEPLGLSRARLVKTAARMADARAALEEAAEAALKETVRLHPAGFAWLDPAGLKPCPREIALRVLARVLMSVSGVPYRPRLDRLERALSALGGEGPDKGRTLGGCRLVPGRNGRVLVCRELRAAAGRTPISPGGVIIWDGRFRVRLAPGLEGGEIGAVGARGLRQLRARKGFDATDIPPPARSALPCLFRGGMPVAAPHLSLGMAGLEIEGLGLADSRLLRFFEPLTTLPS